MDRSVLLDQLILIEMHISVHGRHLLQEKASVEELESKGQDATYARSMLHLLEEIQMMRIADRDRMRAALRKSSFDSPTPPGGS
jgi:hypothetical protein